MRRLGFRLGGEGRGEEVGLEDGFADAVELDLQLAQMYQMPFDQFVKDLQKRNAVNELYEQVLHEKVLELLEKHAVITEAAPVK